MSSTEISRRPSRPGADAKPGPTISDLYSSVVGAEEAQTKLPLLVARDIEERFIRDGWPVGRVYGSEAEMAAHYGVGRDVMREAARVLEARQALQVRRGPRGGLAVAKPSGTHLRVMVGGYAHLTGIELPEIVEAWVAIHVTAVRLIGAHRPGATPSGADVEQFAAQVIEWSGSGLLRRLRDIIAPLLPPMRLDQADAAPELIIGDLERGRGDEAARRTRVLLRAAARETLDRSASWSGTGVPAPLDQLRIPAFRIVRELMSEITPAEWVKGRPLGNEFDLAERLGVDRSVVRQAIRIMEDAETAVPLPGRGRGLMTRCPGSGPLSRQLCIHLAARGEPWDETARALGGLMIELAELAARKAGPADAALLDAAYDRLREPAQAAPISAVQPIERLQNQLAHNALLSLFVDGIKAYLSWSMRDELYAPSWVIDLYTRSTENVLRAIGRGDPAEAERLQAVKLETLAECRHMLLTAEHGLPDADL
ncbi:FadR/GntR family transcriptional regulator [Amycolatopsis tolypomycina]|uniref:DNA-binding transcriptional regulator, FadR family n=1 Tax=Amycolatopsis tolypomycina TaxID=208445 RepID=A0A1H4XYD0_9PSEU|nr:FCD domain-containing protein [Amycolatopsis tolypomycina]SED10639.1 DNA-binding transcriptional regulator, FadR family [Amycolatopsis tolypomycina]